MSPIQAETMGHAAAQALTERSYFEALADAVLGDAVLAGGGELRTSLYLAAEASDFIRFNQAAVRQATHVVQAHITLTLSRGQRSAQASFSLSGDVTQDVQALRAEQATLAADLPLLPEDPYLCHPDGVESSHRDERGLLPEPAALMALVHSHARGLDFVGFYAGGPVARAYADSRGQRNWHRVESFCFEWCLYHAADKAVKTSYAGTHWSDEAFVERLREAAQQVQLLGHPPMTLAPGRYRAYFAPAAVAELLGTLAWGGFSLKEQRTGTSPLMRLLRNEASFNVAMQISEDPSHGTAPGFTEQGYARPARIALVADGRHAGSLCSPRSAREFALMANGAGSGESPEALQLAPGHLPEAEVLKALGTGLYLSNLHYLNYSDRLACRVTGMTRFACFWVEGGVLKAPLNVMRFDDDLLRLFGPDLLALTERAELHPDTATYGSRQLASISAPGALVEGFELTL